ncbi:MAG TPA: NADH-quinone oxidoreductase subunit J, partial [Candidatus Eremiobacteraeota bacterium]|nr:NADH-quinone oxidoreductase subunit J [Candidatus Eremiobacteraeota bacterium]
MIQAITFFLLTIVLIGSAICIVLKKNLFHAALILMLFLFAMAAMYIHLKAELIGVIQVLAYVGGVTTFILFVIMLTAKITDKSEERFNKQRILSIVVMAVVFISFVSLSVHLSSKKMDYFSEGPQTWVKINENTIKDLKNKK